MRFLFLMVSVLFLSSNIAVADYTLRNVYKFENADMVANHDGSNVMNATVTGVSSDSNGNTITNKPSNEQQQSQNMQGLNKATMQTESAMTRRWWWWYS